MKFLEIVLKLDLIELHACGLEETVFEVIQVEHHHPAIEGRLRETDIEIEVFRTLALDFRKHLQSVAQH